ncbi:uncharacterized protein EI97DRAFT_430110 [Westerdykella ornata]|uniref:Protein EFR3 n=1 Tax=Westerdykella ornata TaxID=318751 RepID=A0A6A6JZ85_WESOR|nr:uncharacterized protein EI97DRAFT_430110 [Westerdykella ornata]KAF2280369.1 hypothetical protein EI97DRAFT_430110 [Westerdykella ornata]
MNHVRQTCRPKHQVLVLKCYPKFQKNNVEVRPNSSELSYLLYYASTRRSKLQKLGDFLDKRIIKDVWKGRIGNVQVTLEICKALIEKCPRELPLYAAALMRILRNVLNSEDVTMIEASVPTFEAFCAHQDPANLAADQGYIKRYEEIVRLYALLASKEGIKSLKAAPSWPVAIRYRKAGLQALRAVASSESLGSETGRQLNVIIPTVLWNICSGDDDFLRRLEMRGAEESREQALRRRSISTVQTADEGEADPMAVAGTTEDADKLAEEEVGMIAIQALKNIFMGVTRGQLRLATDAVVHFVVSSVPSSFDDSKQVKDWSTTLMAMVCRWAPVQDRYAILVVTTEALFKRPIVEDDLGRQLLLASIINNLLRSNINFIGLSIMDVLVGLIVHSLQLLQLAGPGSSIVPHQQQATSVSVSKANPDVNSSVPIGGVVMEIIKDPSPMHVRLLETLQACMASLATHVYYSDQICDMVSAIMTRLKPSSLPEISCSAEAIEDPTGAIHTVASSPSLREKQPHVHKFFSFERARLLALRAVKAIIVTANEARAEGNNVAVPRAPVTAKVWEGTQWLLRDPSREVRKAYVDALITWLNMEMARDDLKINPIPRKSKEIRTDVARRAVSNASKSDNPTRSDKSTFLPLLHLAVYESALEHTDSEPDLLLLHLLLYTLVNKLGVNAARTGLPMIWRLQEDILSLTDPGSKVMVGSLVHGYLWGLSATLEFDTSSVGRVLHAEISRRHEKGLWVKRIRVPPVPLESIETPRANPISIPGEVVQSEGLKPFDNRGAFVDKIAEGYTASLTSPPSSPPGSPGRSLSVSLVPPQPSEPPPCLPPSVREDLLADWSREVCIATNAKDTSSASVTGSRTGTSAHHKTNYLGVSIPHGNLDSVNSSPIPSPRRAHSRPPSNAYGLVGRVPSPHRTVSPARTGGSTSSIHSAVRVDELKRVLSGTAPRTSHSFRPRSQRYSPVSTSSESMVSVHSLSEASFVTTEHVHSQVEEPDAERAPRPRSSGRPASPSPQTSSQSPPTHAAREREAAFAANGVPPVPPIPASLRDQSVSPSGRDLERGTASAHDVNGGIAVRKSRRQKRGTGSVRRRGESRPKSNGDVGLGLGKIADSRPDFSGFLDSIDVGDGDLGGGNGRILNGLGQAPY